MAPMKTSWNYQDIIDLEYFAQRDKVAAESDLHQRDRRIYLDYLQATGKKNGLSRREMLRLWLTARRQEEFAAPEERSPGALVADGLRLARGLAVFFGLFLGVGAALSFFTYSGSTPINVLHFLLFFVVSQVLAAGLVFAACLLRLLLPSITPPSFYSLLFRKMMQHLVAAVHKPLLRSLEADKRTAFLYAFDIFRTHGTVYGSLFYWPLFGLMQIFAVFANIGLLAATMGKIITSDLAFGWQSTLQLSNEVLHQVVRLIALPWSWLLPGANGYPSLAEIGGSRMILKDGIHHLETGNLIAWWPFLVLCLIFYGLLLRLVFTVLGRWFEERALSRLELDTTACLTPIRRMRTPLVSSQAAPQSNQAEAGPSGEKELGRDPSEGAHLLPQVVLVPDDIFGLCPPNKLVPLLRDRGFAVKSVQKFMTGYDEDEELKEVLAEACRHSSVGLFILMEGWMPPLVAFLTYIKELREVLPEKTIIHLGLVGRPIRLGFTPLTPQDLNVWRKKLTATRDPYLQVFSLLS